MFGSLFRKQPKSYAPKKRETKPAPLLAVGGEMVALSVRRSARARRFVMRINPNGEVCVTMPARAALAEALAFAREQAGWITSQRARLPALARLAVGAMVPFLGADHEIASGAGPVRCEGQMIYVGGRPEHHARRITDFLRNAARDQLSERAQELAAALDVRIARVTVRDTHSRWGSCSHAGALSFSWRLILAPDFVRDYVVAHEVAHLKEMNHSPRFWAHVEALCPDRVRAQTWLKKNGRDLLRYS